MGAGCAFLCISTEARRGLRVSPSIPLKLFFLKQSFSLNLGNHSFSVRLEISEPQNIILRNMIFFEGLNSEESSQPPESSGIRFCL